MKLEIDATWNKKIKDVIGDNELIGVLFGQTEDEVRVIYHVVETYSITQDNGNVIEGMERRYFKVAAFVETLHDDYMDKREFSTREQALLFVGQDCFACFDN